ncbi:MAG: CPBP family intramembrane glutamic endopeptidase [Pseudomonadota bacterium]
MSPWALIGAGIALSGVGWFAVDRIANGTPGGLTGHLTVLALYWAFFCVPLAVFGVGPSRLRAMVSLRLDDAWFVPWLVMAPAALLLVAGITLEGLASLPFHAYVFGVGIALINAPLEEIAWRGAFLAAGRWRVTLQFAGLILFTAWHIPLALSDTSPIEPWVLFVVSSYALGLIYAIATYRTGRVGWPILGHFAMNCVTLPILFTPAL